MSEWLGTPTLTAGRITLRPFTADDTADLAHVVGEPDRFRWSPGVPTDHATSHHFIATARADPESRVAFAVLDGEQLVGSTSFYDIDPSNLSVAIGYTFYTESAQGTIVNPVSKLLLLQHAFETAGAVRVVWHTNENNTQSRAAIAKLGATFEGLLRKHRRFGDGWRTTAQYAMTDDDWPTVKAALRERIAALT
ncbi:GNAT family N-acetyltransferase [Gordonia soli]|uniref:N-acetyltransferase domain-containing protein n=1 Tax=Gordonia soli NBRC 108243 TaxID=1223545 RepID=M0QEN4_9ACTN|nr:GNAT family protein [Gordonia soli]GAC66884.1 hypothetical protein GS4_05_00930 [Gordonia soli NBRC 108243]